MTRRKNIQHRFVDERSSSVFQFHHTENGGKEVVPLTYYKTFFFPFFLLSALALAPAVFKHIVGTAASLRFLAHVEKYYSRTNTTDHRNFRLRSPLYSGACPGKQHP
jgi:hypothetical protein